MQIRNIPEEIVELEKIFMPFIHGCHLEGATPEAEEAFKKCIEWYRTQAQ